MKIHGSRYRLPPKPPQVDLEELAYEKQQAELAAYIQAKKAHLAELKEKIAALERKLGVKDWLCYLPPSAGSPDFMQKAAQYLEDMRTRIEAAGAKMWLCKDHDFITRVFNITEWRVLNGGVFCAGQFTDRKYHDAFRGVSPDNVTFAGDVALLKELGVGQSTTKAATMTVNDLPEHTRIAAQSDNIFGLAGAVCIENEPGYGRTHVFRVSRREIE